jgi:hypothetical protein
MAIMCLILFYSGKSQSCLCVKLIITIWRRGRITPHILNLSSRDAGIQVQASVPLGKGEELRFPLATGLGGGQSRYCQDGKENYLNSCPECKSGSEAVEP